MKAAPSGVSAVLQRSHADFIKSAILDRSTSVVDRFTGG
jgi:hypothetical protein